MRVCLWIGLLFMISGCMVGPNYRPPEICIPDDWQCDLCEEESPPIRWWEQFNDPLLTCYIEKAACFNNTLLSAKTTILEAIALRQIVASQLFPQLSLGFTTSRTYFSKNGPIFATGVDQTSSLPGVPF